MLESKKISDLLNKLDRVKEVQANEQERDKMIYERESQMYVEEVVRFLEPTILLVLQGAISNTKSYSSRVYCKEIIQRKNEYLIRKHRYKDSYNHPMFDVLNTLKYRIQDEINKVGEGKVDFKIRTGATGGIFTAHYWIEITANIS